jgi:hypothetical protein
MILKMHHHRIFVALFATFLLGTATGATLTALSMAARHRSAMMEAVLRERAAVHSESVTRPLTTTPAKP